MGLGLVAAVVLVVGMAVGSRVFLARVRARLLRMLRQRFGPSAELGTLRLDTTLRLHVRGASIPVGDTGTLLLQHAVLENLRAPRLLSATGAISSLSLRFSSDGSSAPVSGTVHASGTSPTGHALKFACRVAANARGFTADQFLLENQPLPFDAVLTALPEDGWSPRARLACKAVPSSKLVQLLALFHPGPLPLPPVTLDGDVELDASSGARVALQGTGQGLSAALKATISRDGLVGDCTFSAGGDPTVLAPVLGLHLPRDLMLGSTVKLDGTASGPWRNPDVKAVASGLSASWQADAERLVPLDGVELTLHGPWAKMSADASASLAGIPLSATGTLAPLGDPMLRLQTPELDATLLGLVLSLVQGTAAPSLPDGATVAVELTLRRNGEGTGRVHVHHGQAHLTLTPRWASLAHSLQGRLTGTVALEHVLPLLGLTPETRGSLEVDALLSADAGGWKLEGSMETPALDGLVARGSVTFAGDVLAGNFSVDTPRTHLVVRLSSSGGELRGSSLAGRLALRDALPLGLFTSTVRPTALGHADLDATISGTWSAPILEGTFTCPQVALQLAADLAWPRPTFEDVHGTFTVDKGQTAWSVSSDRAFGGTARASGTVGRGPAFVGLRTTVDTRGVQVERLPTRLDGTTGLAAVASGLLTAHFTFNRQGPPGSVLTGQGELRLDDADYPVVERTRSALSAFGLPPPPSAATSPLLCTVALTGGTLRLQDLEAAVHGVVVRGNVAINTTSGSLSGTVKARLDGDYLSRGTLLSLSAGMTGDVTVPITVGGVLGQPTFSADTGSVLGQFLSSNVLVRGVSGALSDVADAFGMGTRPPRRENGEPSATRYDQFIKQDAEDEDAEFLQKLLDSGLSADEIAAALGRKPRGH